MTETIARPPFDPELEAVLVAVADMLPPSITPEMIPLMRGAELPGLPVDDALAEAGVTRRDVTIPGHRGDDIEVTVLQRAGRTGTGPGVFHTHGGGMIMGDRFVGLAQILPWIVELDAVVVTVEYSRRSSPTPTPSRTATRGSSGPRRTRPSSASIPSG